MSTLAPGKLGCIFAIVQVIQQIMSLCFICYSLLYKLQKCIWHFYFNQSYPNIIEIFFVDSQPLNLDQPKYH